MPLLIERLENRRLLHGGEDHDDGSTEDCGCSGDGSELHLEAGGGTTASFGPPRPGGGEWCKVSTAGDTYCCDITQVDADGDCPQSPDYDGPVDPGGPGGGGNTPDDDPSPEDGDPNADCTTWVLKADLVAMGMADAPTVDLPQYEMSPGGYVPLNTGFSEYLAEHPAQNQPEPVPSNLYLDTANATRLLEGVDPELRYGSVAVRTVNFKAAGKKASFSFNVPAGLNVWIKYDTNTGDSLPADWVKVGSQTFYAGDTRPWSFPIAYEGQTPGLEKQVTVNASASSFCTATRSTKHLTGTDSVLLHVLDFEADADADNDAGFDPASPDLATLKDRWIEWFNEHWSVPTAGKLATLNDGDLDHAGAGDGVPDWADGFDGLGSSPADPRDDLMLANSDPTLHQFVPIQFTLPAWHHGDAYFRFEYDAADPVYAGHSGVPTGDAYDMTTGYDAGLQQRWFALGLGSARLWTKPAHEARDNGDIDLGAGGGDYIDSFEWNSASGTQEPVFYPYSAFGVDPATGGTITLYLESVRPSAALGGHSVTLHAKIDEVDSVNGGSLLPAYSFSDEKIVPITAVGVDLDIDSDNDSGFALPDGDHVEDAFEAWRAGKLLVVNRDDDDGDRILDYADGFNALAGLSNGSAPDAPSPTPEITPGEQFAPLVLRVEQSMVAAFGGATVTFRYDAADPADLLNTSSDVEALDGTTVVKHAYDGGDGLLRLWRKPGDAARSLADYVAPDEPVGLSTLIPPDAPDQETLTLYVEAVNGSPTATTIEVELAYTEGPTARDAVRVLPLDPLLGIDEESVLGYRLIRGDGSSLVGTPHNDLLIGTSAHEHIEGLEGDDIILAGRNVVHDVDTIDDPDTFAGDTINGGAGADLIFAYFGSNPIAHDPADERSRVEGQRVSEAGAAVDKPFTSEDIEAAYRWMYGDDIWLQTFKELGGRVLAVDQDGRWFSDWTIDWHQTQTFGAYTGYDVKIEYDVESVMHAAAILRQGIMSTARRDFRWTQELQERIADPTVYGSPEEDYQALRQRNFDYAKEVASLAATLYVNGMTLGFGAAGDVADVVIALPAASEGDLGAMLAMLPLVPGAVSQLGRARLLVNFGFEKFLMRGDVLVREGSTLGFVLRNDLVAGAIERLKIERIPTPSGKATWLIGTPQPVFELVDGVWVETTHAATTLRKATELSQSGTYAHVTMARNWRTATGRAGGEATSDRVPDIIAVRWDGKVEAFEIKSNGDQEADLFQRLQEGMDTLPQAHQTNVTPANIIPLDP